MIILASLSNARIRLLKAAGVSFERKAHRVEEHISIARETAPRMAERLAMEKALSLMDIYPGDIVIGSDQTLECDGAVFSKPRHLGELESQLLRLRGRTHMLHAALACVQEGKVVFSALSTAKLTMRRFSDAFLASYIARHGDNLLSCVGGYKIEAEGIQLFEAIEGDNFTIQGMPLLPLLGFLRSRGHLET